MTPPSPSRRHPRALSVALGLTLAATPLAVLAAPAEAASGTVRLITVNDFHGRIDANTTKWATTIETARTDSSLVISAGDNIGASLFASSYADDEPTIEVLNALEFDSATVGNHEFDKGFPWFESHVVDGTGADYTGADFPYLGANVIDRATGEPALQPSTRESVGGLSVCTVGAVTQETPALVSPDGVSMLEFTDPVAAVNAEVQALEQQQPCDVTVAVYHEGGPQDGSDAEAFEDNMANPVFAHMVNDTSNVVDVIVNGHTHRDYAYQAPRPDGEGTRTVVQSASYGTLVGQIDLTVTDGEVTAATAQQLNQAGAANLDLPRVAAVKPIVDRAIAESNEIGNQPVGTISDDISRARSGGNYGPDGYTGDLANMPEQRGEESSLGDLVADALKTPIPAMGDRRADIGVVNPGGLRADLLFAGDAANPANKDGVVTFAEANAVLPFVNNINYVDLTGAQFKRILEEQWQRDKDGNIPSRAFLHLGLSSNVQTTLDPAQPEGSRVTSVRVDGEPLDPAATYTIATFSFLAQGGDNFHTFKQGAVTDTGAVDRDLWIDHYFRNGETKRPDFARQQVYTDAPARFIGGTTTDFTVDRLDLISLGAPANTTLSAELRTPDDSSTELGDWPVTDGTAEVSVSVPAGFPVGSTVVFTAAPSGTTFEVPATPRLIAAVTNGPVVARQTRAEVKVSVFDEAGEPASGGTVRATQSGLPLAAAAEVVDGVATLTLPTFPWPGDQQVDLVYSGSGDVPGAESTLTVPVVRATPDLQVRVRPDTTFKVRVRPRVVVTARADGQDPVTGRVVIRTAGSTYQARLQDGRAVVRLKRYPRPGGKVIRVTYQQTRLNNAVTDRVRVRVTR